MKRNVRVKSFFILAVILICVYGIIGIPTSKDQLIANWRKNIHLGLDLRGGTYLVVQVQQQDAFNAQAELAVEQLKEACKQANITYAEIIAEPAASLQTAKNAAILVKGVASTQTGLFRNTVNDELSQWALAPQNSSDFRLTMKPAEALRLWQSTLTQSKTVYDRKINALGLREASVQQRRGDADSELLIQMPEVSDPGHVRQILQTAANLELYPVQGGPYGSRTEALAQMGGVVPLGTKLVEAARAGSEGSVVYLLSRTPVVRGPDIRDARAEQGELPNTWDTGFVLSQAAAKKFSTFTGRNIGSRLAVVLDGKVVSAPVIENQIGDQGRIRGAANQQAAIDLALNLKAGSLPAGITFGQETTIGPSLGADSIRSGVVAALVGISSVVFMMLIYYKKAGVNATLALFLNALILIAGLAYFDAVLTLPGIAGVILTIGMAVDSNVLIFERIREEVRVGKPPDAAVDVGFSKALLTIIDTHVTTVVSCAILFLFGSGPVKGFAVTLVIGLVANMFTAVFVSKTMFDWQLTRPSEVKSLSI